MFAERERVLQLVRHAAPRIDPGVEPSRWQLRDDAFAALDALRTSGRIRDDATWFCSDETKAITSAACLTDRPFTVVPNLREAERRWIETTDDFSAAVERTILEPDATVGPGWETGREVQDRVATAVHQIVTSTSGDLVLVGHGTAWTLLAARLRDRVAGIDAWRSLKMPDVWTLDLS